ncbi:MAG: PH domain-containing protein [Pseudomonadota bacterium]
MRYVKHLLLPNEEILYDGHVHPRVLLPGFLWLMFAAYILHEASNTGGGSSIFLRILYNLSFFEPINKLYNTLENWQTSVPNIAFDIKIIALGVMLYGLYRFITQFILLMTTELVITNLRVIAKTGITTVITVEIDRRRISGVLVVQSLAGRIMDYGNVVIQGFTTSIGGLPILVNPHLVEKFLS